MAAADTAGTSFSDTVSASFDTEGEELPPGVGPWKLAWRRLRRNKVALFFGFIFVLLVVLCLLAPVYSHDIAHTGPNTEAGLTATYLTVWKASTSITYFVGSASAEGVNAASVMALAHRRPRRVRIVSFPRTTDARLGRCWMAQ